MVTGVSKYYVRCLICEEHYTALSQHLRFKHRITAREYKEEFGLNYNQPLEAEVVTEKRRCRAYQYGTFKENCLKKGTKTQFKKGDKGNTRLCDQRLEQLRALPQRFKLKNKEDEKI